MVGEDSCLHCCILISTISCLFLHSFVASSSKTAGGTKSVSGANESANSSVDSLDSDSKGWFDYDDWRLDDEVEQHNAEQDPHYKEMCEISRAAIDIVWPMIEAEANRNQRIFGHGFLA